jgi:hypothetical protein
MTMDEGKSRQGSDENASRFAAPLRDKIKTERRGLSPGLFRNMSEVLVY